MNTIFLSLAVSLSALTSGCDENFKSKRHTGKKPVEAPANPSGPAPVTPPDHFALDSVTPLSSAEAHGFFRDRCITCHESQSGPMKSFFSMDKDTFTPESLATAAIGPTAYYTLFRKAFAIEGKSPSAMPPGQSDDAERAYIKRLLRWFELNQPELVLASARKYNFSTVLNKTKVISNFSCTKPVTYREFIARVTSDAFDRLPTTAELTADPDHIVSPAERTGVAKRIFEDAAWRSEFMNIGLRKFARKLSGAGQIRPSGAEISEKQAKDLQDELYQLLLRDFNDKSFKDILLAQSIPVSAETAPFYGCAAPASGWSDCQLEARRRSYFASMSFLRAAPSSFLQENNNYKRVAMMQFMISGDVILPATDGPAGDAVVTPLPSCLKTVDTRGVEQSSGAVAPFGSAAIPAHGNLCQSCHIDRYLAAGSMLFRPFNRVGLMYGSTLARDITNDADFATATQDDRVRDDGQQKVTVTADYLQNLLTAQSEQACVTGINGSAPVATVSDLANHLIGDGEVLSTGLAKHMPRAFSNLSHTSDEILRRVSEAYAAGDGKLAPIFEAYFASETYSCERQN